ncbi:unnamed protein product [Lymnaea stagnalis]|uniref:LKB1 serine/threonine kinase interacting protein 1 N-terminal domain-containing protein n=1 Tax=Lymnaea stagnalis TaxID=6523 RepID=A0AAV2H476_LYMST
MALSNHDGVANISYLSSIGSSSLRKLCALLRNEGHRVLSGNSAFTLTTEVLSHINGACRRHSVTELENLPAGNGGGSFLALTKRMQEQQQAIKAKTEWAVCIQFIQDFMLSTPSLKV